MFFLYLCNVIILLIILNSDFYEKVYLFICAIGTSYGL